MRRLAPAAALAIGILLLTACGPGTGSPTPSPSVSESASASPEPSETPSEEPTEPEALTCEGLLDAASLADFTANGLTITPPDEFSTKLHSEGNPHAAFFDAGGILCQVAQAGNFHSVEVYGWAPFTEENSADLRASLLTDGYAETVTDAGVQYTLDAGSEGAFYYCYFRFGEFGGCAMDADRLQEVFDNAP